MKSGEYHERETAVSRDIGLGKAQIDNMAIIPKIFEKRGKYYRNGENIGSCSLLHFM